MTKTNNPKVLLREWLDVCAVYRVLHNISFEFFQKKTHNMAIPAIILTATGAGLAFSTQIFPAEATLYIPALVGVLNLIAGTFTSVSSFKKYAEQSEGHRVSSISFSKLSRKIKHKFVTITRIIRNSTEGYTTNRHPKPDCLASARLRLASAPPPPPRTHRSVCGNYSSTRPRTRSNYRRAAWQISAPRKSPN